MVWRYGKRFALLLVLFWQLSSLHLSADVCLTDAEFQELQTIFSRLETLSIEQEARLTQLETQLETAETSLTTSTTEIEKLRILLSERDKYWQTRMQEQRTKAVTVGVITALISVIVGFIAGHFI
jgi:t-SNARE complex subunit (syntaxin)